MLRVLTDSVVWGLASVLLAACVTLSAVNAPGPALQLLSLLLATGAGWAVRKCLSWRSRIVCVGLALGSGGLLFELTGGTAPLIVLVLISSMVVREERLSRLALFLWLLGVTSMGAGTLLTASIADLPLSRLVTVLGLILAFAWSFQRHDRPTASITLQIAGLTAAFGVFVSWILGRPVFAESAVDFSTTEAGVIRAAGFQSHPNEAAIVLSAALISMVFRYLQEQGSDKERQRQRLPIASIALVGLALLMTGSRSALLGAFAAISIYAVTKFFSGKGRRAVLVAALACAGALILTGLGTFAGRSLNVLEGNDGSAVYRKDVQSRLWQAADFTQWVGFGFDSGSLLAVNPITNGISHIDNAWLFMLFAFGVFVPVGLILLLCAALARSWNYSGLAAIGSICYVALVSSAENIWVLTGTSICVVLSVVSTADTVTARKISFENVPRPDLGAPAKCRSLNLDVGGPEFGRSIEKRRNA